MESVTQRKIKAAARSGVLLSAWASFMAATWLWLLPWPWALALLWGVLSVALAAGMDV